MTKYYSSWHLNPALIPADPGERIELWIRLLEKVKADLKSGCMLDWGVAADLTGGYAIMDTDEMGILADAAGYRPFILGEIKPVLTPDQAAEVLKRMAAAITSRGS